MKMNIWSSIIPILLAIIFYVSGDTVNIAWNAPINYSVDHYEIKLIRETGETVVYTSTVPTYTLSRTGAGKYLVEITAFDAIGNQSSPCSSIDATCAILQDGVTLGTWEIQWNPTPPGGVTHE